MKREISWLEIPEPSRRSMERGFGADFSDVRIHVDSIEARELGARAFACGRELYFAPGEFATGGFDGRMLLGHELTHVLQQRRQLPDEAYLDPMLEWEAQECGRLVAQGLSVDGLFPEHPVERPMRPVVQPMLILDSTNAPYLAAARNALNILTGNILNGLTFTTTLGLVGGGPWEVVTAGPQIAAARAACPQGTRLVEEVINNFYVCRIMPAAGGNGTSPEHTGVFLAIAFGLRNLDTFRSLATIQQRSVTPGLGCSVRVEWDPQPENTMDMSAAGHIMGQQCPSYVTLAHEFIHTVRCFQGIVAGIREPSLYFLLDTRPHRDHAAWGQQYGLSLYHDVRTGNWYQKATELQEEIVTVGMPLPAAPRFQPSLGVPVHPLGITENTIRLEHMLPLRLKYGNCTEGVPSALPRYIGNQ